MRIAIFVTVVGGETAVVLKILARTLDAVAKAATPDALSPESMYWPINAR